jgi:hypothetical protein
VTPTPPVHAAGSRRALAVALALSGLSVGCAEGFDPYNRLGDLRVLALRSEPAAPGPGETTALDALVYLPPGDTVASYQWSWCPYTGPSTDGYPCLISEDELAELAGDRDFPPYDLGTEATASFAHTLDPDLLAGVCASAADVGEASLIDCAEGFPARVTLVVRGESGAEIETVRTLHLRFDEDQEPNANPIVTGLRAVLDGDEEVIGEEPTLTLLRNEETVVRADVPEESIESYTGVDDDGAPEERVEELILTWFVESGDTKSERTAFLDGIEPLEDATENEWEPDAVDDYERETSSIYVIVRDDRDGIAWVRGEVALGEAP